MMTTYLMERVKMATHEQRLNQANGRLKAAKVGVTIHANGGRLHLRATLPPRPGSTRKDAHQQRIALGIYNNPDGVSRAEKQARLVGALLARCEFDWTPYLKLEAANPLTVGDWVERFESDYFKRRERNNQSQTTWKGDYLKVFNKLPQNEPLTVELLNAQIGDTQPDTKTRKRTCMAIGALAKFAGIEMDVAPMSGKYGVKSTAARDLPTDALIMEYYDKFSNPDWQWVYGMMAAYGLRNHEVFRLDFDALKSSDSVVKVLEGKTGPRLVYPFYPEWFEDFQLQDVRLPPINLDRPNEALGRTVGQYFHGQVGLPFPPYNLRHAWAVRTIGFLLPVEMAAQQMGHSVVEHTKTYHRWITADHQKRVVDALMSRSGRPRLASHG
jgi:integrase